MMFGSFVREHVRNTAQNDIAAKISAPQILQGRGGFRHLLGHHNVTLGPPEIELEQIDTEHLGGGRGGGSS